MIRSSRRRIRKLKKRERQLLRQIEQARSTNAKLKLKGTS